MTYLDPFQEKRKICGRNGVFGRVVNIPKGPHLEYLKGIYDMAITNATLDIYFGVVERYINCMDLYGSRMIRFPPLLPVKKGAKK